MPNKTAFRVPFIINDLVIKEESCNLACEYCLTGQSQFKATHSMQMVFHPPLISSCLPGTEMYTRLHELLDALQPQDVPVVKISGGEVLLIRGIIEFIEELSSRYETVVLLTNGLLLTNEKLKRLTALGNVVLQISLDSTLYEGNSYRVSSHKIQNAVIEKFNEILRSGLDVEVYTILNNRSITTLEKTMTELLPYAGKLTLFPFPVRGPTSERFFPSPEQVVSLRNLVDNIAAFETILPGRAYINHLLRFFHEGGRRFSCNLPRVAYTSFDDGMITSCPNIWFDNAGNALEEPVEKIFSALADSRFRRLLLSKVPRLDACKKCFSPWDLISFYFEGEMTLHELSRIPVYRGKKTRQRLEEIRSAYTGRI